MEAPSPLYGTGSSIGWVLKRIFTLSDPSSSPGLPLSEEEGDLFLSSRVNGLIGVLKFPRSAFPIDEPTSNRFIGYFWGGCWCRQEIPN